MRRVIASFLGLVLISACTKSNEAPQPSPKVIQKRDVAVPHKRYYFSYGDCDYSRLKYEGWNSTEAFETILPDEINDETSWKYIRAQFKKADQVLFETYAVNPIVDSMGEWDKYSILRCKATFFIDVPADQDVTEADSLHISNIVWEEEFDQPLNLKDQPKAGLASTEVTTLAKVLGNTPYRVMKFFGTADSAQAWDLVVLGDGYTASELNLESEDSLRKSKFGLQLQAMLDEMFKYEPYKSLRNSINIWVVAVPSKESGTDIPAKKIVKDTFYNSTTGVDCYDRAVTVKYGLVALEMASKTPFDQILVLVNSDEDAGTGGTFAISTITPDYIETVIHELGHSVGLLADTYYYFSDDQVASEFCEDPGYEDYVVEQEEDHGVNGLYDEDDKMAPNLTLNAGADAKWVDLLPINYEPVYMVYGKEIGKYDGATNSVTVTMQFRDQFSKIIFMGGTDPWTNDYLAQFTRILINGVEVPKDKITVETRPGYREDSAPEMPPDYKFFILDVAVPHNVDVAVTFEFAKDYDPEWVDDIRGNANAFKFVSYVFDPNQIGLFEGANPALSGVYRSSFASMMMNLGSPYDKVEERAMYSAIEAFTVPPAPQQAPQQK